MADASKEFTDSFLNDVEKDALQNIADNPTAFNALKKIVLADVYFKGTLEAGKKPDPTRNAALAFEFGAETKSNEQIGEEIRAMAAGVRLVETGFARLESFKTVQTPAKAPKITGR